MQAALSCVHGGARLRHTSYRPRVAVAAAVLRSVPPPSPQPPAVLPCTASRRTAVSSRWAIVRIDRPPTPWAEGTEHRVCHAAAASGRRGSRARWRRRRRHPQDCCAPVSPRKPFMAKSARWRRCVATRIYPGSERARTRRVGPLRGERKQGSQRSCGNWCRRRRRVPIWWRSGSTTWPISTQPRTSPSC